MANSLVEALQKEKKVVAEDGWLEDKSGATEKPSLIGFDLGSSESYYSPHLKKQKKKI